MIKRLSNNAKHAMPNSLRSFLLMLSLFSLTACLDMNDPISDPGNTSPAALESGQPWRLLALADQPVPPNPPVTLSFSREGRISGNGGCNNYFGIFKADPTGQLTIGRVGSTKMLCPDGADTEDRFFESLESVTGFAVEGDRLRLFSYAGDLEFTSR